MDSVCVLELWKMVDMDNMCSRVMGDDRYG